MFSTLGPKFGHFGGRIRILLEKLYIFPIGNVWSSKIWSPNQVFLFFCFFSGVFSSKPTLNSNEIHRKIDKTLLEYRVEFPQMDAPNGWDLVYFFVCFPRTVTPLSRDIEKKMIFRVVYKEVRGLFGFEFGGFFAKIDFKFHRQSTGKSAKRYSNIGSNFPKWRLQTVYWKTGNCL